MDAEVADVLAGRREWALVGGDALEALPRLPAASAHSVVTDPPYELGFMGKRWDNLGVAFDPATWEAVLRVLRPGGYLVATGGTRTWHRLACALEDAGFEMRDTLCWLHGQGFPKGKGCLKPAWEPILLCRRPGPKVLPLPGLDECRVGANGRPLLTKRPNGIPGNSLRGSLDASLNGSKAVGTTDAGRWPANVVLSCACEGDHEPDCPVRLLDEQSGERKSPAPYVQQSRSVGIYGPEKEHDRLSMHHGDSGGASRFFYTAKASRAEREAGLEGMPAGAIVNYGHPVSDPMSPNNYVGGQQARVAAGLPPSTPRANTHPCCKPLALMRWLVRLVTPPGGICLDSFAGSGTTGVACLQTGRRFIGVEISPEYAALSRRRLEAAERSERDSLFPARQAPAPEPSLFAEEG